MNWKDEYKRKLRKADEAVQIVKSNDRVYAGTCTSVAYTLLQALWERRYNLDEVKISCCNILKPNPIFYDFENNPFKVESYFMGAGERNAGKNGSRLDFTSMNLSQIDLWCKEVAPPDICFFDVSQPDENGYMNYGLSGTALNTYLKEVTKKIVVQVCKQTPYIFGRDNLIHVSEVDMIVESDDTPPTLADPEIDYATQELSKAIMEHIPDGATIQLGLGGISTAIGFALESKNDLGIHSELFNEPMMRLMKNGNVTNKRKGFNNGKSVFSFSIGSSELYEFIDRNPEVYCAPYTYVNDSRNVAKNKKMVSINTAMSLDVFGQVAADSLGWRQQSGIGGQLDFVKGAQWSDGGKSFIATTSSFVKDGERVGRITLAFPPGTAITTPRSEIQYVATEYGCVNLKRLQMSDRVKAMISLAHPDFRDALTADARNRKLI